MNTKAEREGEAERVKAEVGTLSNDDLVQRYRQFRRKGEFKLAGYFGMELGRRIGYREAQQICRR